MSQIWNRATASSMGSVLFLEGNAGGPVGPDGAGIIDVLGGVGGRNTNTVGNLSPNTLNVELNNTITLGDLSVVLAGNDALTVVSGDITVSGTGVGAGGNINMPNTGGTTPGDIGVINYGGNRFIHNWGTSNTFVGSNAGNFTTTATGNVGVGSSSLNAITTAAFNVAVGYEALLNKATGGFNVAIGGVCMRASTTSGNTTAVGHAALRNITTGTQNCVMGTNVMDEATTASNNLALGTGGDGGGALEKGPLFKLISGTNNIAIGCATAANLTGPGFNYTGAESSNILIGGTTVGVAGENNTMRLGTTGAGAGQVNRCFLAGVDGVNVGSVAEVVTMGTGANADQLGTAVITAGAGITVTPAANTITVATNSSAGNWVLLQTQTAAASTSIDFTGIISATYDTYVLVMSNAVPSTQATFQLLVSTNNGSTYETTNYQTGNGGKNVTVPSWSGLTGNTTHLILADNVATTVGAAGKFWLYNVSNGNSLLMNGDAAYNRAGAYWSTITGGVAQYANVNALRIVLNTGTITTGTFSLYGIVQ